MRDPSHELFWLANKIDWSGMDAAFVDTYNPDIGAPAKAIRLMVGLHYLKYAFDESDESVAARWVENPYWQYFCGYTHMQHECPIHPTGMTKWRNRVGAKRLERLLAETIALAVREKHLPKSDLERVTVETTVQEKNIIPHGLEAVVQGNRQAWRCGEVTWYPVATVVRSGGQEGCGDGRSLRPRQAIQTHASATA